MFGKSQSKAAAIDPNRAALAEAIGERDEAERKAEAAKSAVERASALLEAAEARCEETQAALVGRRSEGAQRVLEAATTGAPGMPDVSMREARVADLDAADALEAAKSALASCMATLKNAEGDLRHEQWRVETAVAPVLAASADRVVAEAARLKDELDGVRAILAFLQRSLEAGSPLQHRVMMALPPSPPGVFAPDYRSHPALAAWRDAREALLRDAAAPMPN
jgi:hypothetical protein